jgi:3-hydroxymyristoyl/3-hydroxydecanoyl-(acyl carrier protein) dehydratase
MAAARGLSNRMDAHSRAFSFVDRIISVHDGAQIRGRYRIPSQRGDFPLSLVGEAVGQLAAWAAMAAVDFAQRPVAGLAGSIELLGEPRAGQVLELAAHLDHVDAESVEYSGTAHLDDNLLIRLIDCVGPMLQMSEFDDQQKVRLRFEELSHIGAVVGGFPGLPELKLERTGGEAGDCVWARFQVPTEAAFFADHFPRRPVFPGSLLMHMKLQLAAVLAAEIPPPAKGRWMPGIIHDMKLRTFIPPGTTVRLGAKLKQRSLDRASLDLETRAAGEVIATAGLTLKEEEGL